MSFRMLCRAALALSLSTCALDSTGPGECTAEEKVNNPEGCAQTQQSVAALDWGPAYSAE